MNYPLASMILVAATSVILILFISVVVTVYLLKVKSYKASLELFQALNEEKERTMQYVAMEIHDNFTQMLCLTQMALYMINDHATDTSRKEITTAIRYVDKMITVSHNLINSLYPENLKEQGLIATIKEEIEWINNINTSNIQFHFSGTPYQVSDTASMMVFRIVQEGLSNAIKHARASNISVYLHYHPKCFELVIHDDGIGFIPEEQQNHTDGNGLRNLQKRAGICGGILHIESRIMEGTEVRLRIHL